LFSGLLGQAERMRLSLLTLARLRRRLARDTGGADAVGHVDAFREAASQMADAIRVMLSGGTGATTETLLKSAADATELLRRNGGAGLSTFSGAVARDAVHLMESITGQFRAVVRMAEGTSPVESADAAPQGFDAGLRPPGTLLLRTRLATLRANLSFRSVAFRHAVRLAACIMVGEAVSTQVDWQRSYWIPMTIAIVLKPDFLSTFSRGALRLAGTFGGLVVATAIYRVLPLSPVTDTAVVGIFTLVLRWWGPANYGILSLAVSAIVVALIAGTGVAPHNVIVLRGLNTAIGGVLAMLAYALWPTWERAHVGESFARLLDSYRTYLRAVRVVYVHPETVEREELDRTRQSARVARTNAEASADRLGVEPATPPRLVALAAAMLASSHNFIYAAMTLEAGAQDGLRAYESCVPVLREFLDQVDLMLYFLGLALRNSDAELHRMYDLRERYRTLAECLGKSGLSGSLIEVESDRMTNALNTLRQQVLEWTGERKRVPAV
jgi:uncharacterized membrane protein YccC